MREVNQMLNVILEKDQQGTVFCVPCTT